MNNVNFYFLTNINIRIELSILKLVILDTLHVQNGPFLVFRDSWNYGRQKLLKKWILGLIIPFT